MILSLGGLTNGTSQNPEQRYTAKGQRSEHKIFAALWKHNTERTSQVIQGGTLSWLERLTWEVSPFQSSGAVQERDTISNGHKNYRQNVTVEVALVPFLLVGTTYLTL